MAFISGGAAAAAVSRAGGLGFLGAGYGDQGWLEEEARQVEGERVGVGFITWSLAQRPSLLDLALDQKPAAVWLSFGDARPFAAPVTVEVLCWSCRSRPSLPRARRRRWAPT